MANRAKKNPVVPPTPPTPTNPDDDQLSNEEMLFVESYLIYRQYAAAYRQVFPHIVSVRDAARAGHRMAHRPRVRQEINAAIQDQRLRKRATADGVIDELARIAYSDILDLYDPTTQTLRHPRHIPFDTRRAIASMKVTQERITETTTRNGRNRISTRTAQSVVEYKFWDKNSALSKLANHLGLNTELPPLEALLRLLPHDIAAQVRTALAASVQRPHERNGALTPPQPNGAQT